MGFKIIDAVNIPQVENSVCLQECDLSHNRNRPRFYKALILWLRMSFKFTVGNWKYSPSASWMYLKASLAYSLFCRMLLWKARFCCCSEETQCGLSHYKQKCTPALNFFYLRSKRCRGRLSPASQHVQVYQERCRRHLTKHLKVLHLHNYTLFCIIRVTAIIKLRFLPTPPAPFPLPKTCCFPQSPRQLPDDRLCGGHPWVPQGPGCLQHARWPR